MKPGDVVVNQNCHEGLVQKVTGHFALVMYGPGDTELEPLHTLAVVREADPCECGVGMVGGIHSAWCPRGRVR